MKLSNRGNGLGYILFFSLSCLLIQININAAQQLQSPKVILRLSDGTGLPLKKREIDRMGMIKAHVEMQETNVSLDVPVADDFVTPEAGTLLMHLMENVLGDTDYETNPEQINNNKIIVKSHLDALLTGNTHKFNTLKNLYGAADYLNVQLLKTSEQSDANPQEGDHALQKLIAYETANSLLAGEYTIDLNVSHRNLNEDLKLELAQKYKHAKVLIKEINVNGHQEYINQAQLSADGATLMTCSFEKVIVRNIQTGAVLLSVTRGDVNGHQETIWGAKLSADGATLVTRSYEKVMVRNIQTGAVLFTVTRGDVNSHRDNIWGAKLSPDGATLMTFSCDKVIVRNIQTGAVLCTVARGDVNGHQDYIYDAQLSADGATLVTRSYDKVMVCNAQTGAVLLSVTRGDVNGHQDRIYGAQLSADGATLMTYSDDKTMYHNLPIIIHSGQNLLNKYYTEINNANKTVSIYQTNFTEETANNLSLEQIYAAVYAQQHGQEYPKISIVFAELEDRIQALFIEAPEVIEAPQPGQGASDPAPAVITTNTTSTLEIQQALPNPASDY